MPRKTALERFEEKYVPEPNSGCWLWIGRLCDGYGRFDVHDSARKKSLPKRAHKWAYENLRRPVPPDRQLDHLCRVRCCVNPDHLEAVTSKENTLRGEGVSADNSRKRHCPKGHEYVSRTDKGQPYRRCLICHRVDNKKWKEKKKCLEHNAESSRPRTEEHFSGRQASGKPVSQRTRKAQSSSRQRKARMSSTSCGFETKTEARSNPTKKPSRQSTG